MNGRENVERTLADTRAGSSGGDEFISLARHATDEGGGTGSPGGEADGTESKHFGGIDGLKKDEIKEEELDVWR